jgi:hypothetical protein
MKPAEIRAAAAALDAAMVIVGGPAGMERRLKARKKGAPSRQAIRQWVTVPPQHVLDVEAVVMEAIADAQKVTRHTLRPDFYPPGA